MKTMLALEKRSPESAPSSSAQGCRGGCEPQGHRGASIARTNTIDAKQIFLGLTDGRYGPMPTSLNLLVQRQTRQDRRRGTAVLAWRAASGVYATVVIPLTQSSCVAALDVLKLPGAQSGRDLARRGWAINLVPWYVLNTVVCGETRTCRNLLLTITLDLRSSI